MTDRRTLVTRLAFAAALLIAASTSQAGHRSCSSCGTAGRSAGNWYHFTSGGGMYVPTARTAVASTSMSACATCQPIRTVSHQTVVYGATVRPAAQGCSTCRSR